MTYCISDIHGCFDEFMELLEKIEFNSNDKLYILGDIIDRGEKPIECIKYVMEQPNITMLKGNHEQMMMDTMFNNYYDTPEYLDNWMYNGGNKVLMDFINLPDEDKTKIIEFIVNLPYTYQVKIDKQNYVLVHAGINVIDTVNSFTASTAPILKNQNSDEMVWIRDKFFNEKALPNSITIFGHTPMQMLKSEDDDISTIWHDETWHDKIGIDGGCVYGGNLIALRLDDMTEFSVKKHDALE